MTAETSNVPPTTIGCVEAEAAVLGGIMRMDLAEADAVVAQLEAEDFTDPRHRVVLEAMRRCVVEDVPPDPVTVLGELRRTGDETSFTAARSAGVYLYDLLAAAVTAASAGHYARVVIEHRARRRLQEAATRLEQVAGTTSFTLMREVALDEWTALLAQLDRIDPEGSLG